MRSYHLTTPGAGVDGLELRDHPDPEPGPGDVLVRIRAAGLSMRELLVLAGDYPLPITPGIVPGCDGVGEVLAVGSEVTGIVVGDRVAAIVFPEWQDGPFRREVAAQLGSSRPGALTELAVLPATGVVPIPDHLSYPEAATYPLTGVTAWHALFGGRPVRAGETVLTLGTGGVSLHALQFAKAAGARVIATTSSAAKAAELTALGADHVVDRRAHPDWSAEVRALTGGVGVDHVVEVAGSLTRSLRAAGYGAEIALIGTWLADDAPIAARELFGAGAVVRPLAVGSRQHAVEMNRAIDQLRLRPLVHRVFGFDEVPDALRYQAKGGFPGKVVISLD